MCDVRYRLNSKQRKSQTKQQEDQDREPVAALPKKPPKKKVTMCGFHGNSFLGTILSILTSRAQADGWPRRLASTENYYGTNYEQQSNTWNRIRNRNQHLASWHSNPDVYLGGN